jgi:hypothetical protein
MKESYPVQVAEFAVSQGISEAPAFRWWVKDVLRQGTVSSKPSSPGTLNAHISMEFNCRRRLKKPMSWTGLPIPIIGIKQS